jgi:hypothetical protein
MKTKLLKTFFSVIAIISFLTLSGLSPAYAQASPQVDTATSEETNSFLEKNYGFGLKDMPKMVCKKDAPKDPGSGKKGWAVCQSALRGDYVAVNWIDISSPRLGYQMSVVRDFLKALSFSGSAIPKTNCEWNKTFKDDVSGMDGVFIDCITEASLAGGLASPMYISFFYFVNSDRKEISETLQNILVFSEATSFDKVDRTAFIARTRNFITSGRLFKR